MKEADLYNDLRALAAKHGWVLFRNNVGMVEKNGYKIRFGLCVGSADLIGLDVRTGKFISIEVKLPGKQNTATKKQLNFLHMVDICNGISGIVTSEKDLLEMIEQRCPLRLDNR